jgi:phage protein D
MNAALKKKARCWLEVTDPDTEKQVAVRWTDVISIKVENTLYVAADSFDITLKNELLLSDYLRKEQEIRVWIGYVKDTDQWSKDELTHIFTGKIDGVRPLFANQMTLQLAGRDFSATLIDDEFSLAFAERTASQVAEILAERHKLTPIVTATTVVVERDLYKDRKEWEILQELADREGFVCYVTKEKELYFGPRKDSDDTVAAEYMYRKGEESNIISVQFDDSMVMIYNRVLVRHWMSKHKQLIEGEAKNQELIDRYGEKTRIFYDPKAKTKELADQMAEKRLKELARAVTTAEDCKVWGDPSLEAEKIITFANVGRFAQKYYLERITHELSKGAGYTCSLNGATQRPDSAAQYRKDIYNFQEKTM